MRKIMAMAAMLAMLMITAAPAMAADNNNDGTRGDGFNGRGDRIDNRNDDRNNDGFQIEFDQDDNDFDFNGFGFDDDVSFFSSNIDYEDGFEDFVDEADFEDEGTFFIPFDGLDFYEGEFEFDDFVDEGFVVFEVDDGELEFEDVYFG